MDKDKDVIGRAVGSLSDILGASEAAQWERGQAAERRLWKQEARRLWPLRANEGLRGRAARRGAEQAQNLIDELESALGLNGVSS